MGKLVEGQWYTTSELACSNKTGAFEREQSSFRNWVEADANAPFPAQADRYHLYISYACPWASRTLIMRQLKGLAHVISYSTVDALMGDNGWTFAVEGEHSQDPINQFTHLHQVYTTAKPNYTGKVTVPVLWDKHTRTIVNNESADIIRMLNDGFNELADNKTDYYPAELRADIDEINAFVYPNINNGVYRCGFANKQAAYDRAFEQLFSALDQLETRLGQQRYLVGNTLTEADVRLFTTLIRFDAVYVGHFKTNLRRIDDYANLSNYLRDLYQYPGIAETVRFDHIKNHYYQSHLAINPTGIVPKGPALDYQRPHDRARFTE